MRICRQLACTLLLAGLVGCSRQAPTPPAELPPKGGASDQAAAKPEKTLRIAVCPKGTVHEFWQTVKKGAETAGDEVGAEILWNGPPQETMVAEQITIIEDFLTNKVDAVVMAACDAKALVHTTQKALDAKIPVITIDSGLDPDISLSFVATDNVAGATEAAHELARLVGGKGEVGLIPFIKGAATSDQREKGFREGLKAHKGLKLVSTLYSQSDVGKGMNVTEDMLTAHPNLAGLFAANEPGALGCLEALKARKLASKVKVVAFDASDGEIKALEEGGLQALVVQNPFQMGYQGVMQARKAIDGEKCDRRVDTGVTVVTRENLNKPEVQKILYPLGKK
jgi:ribose transport system substrate-binding protein